MNATDARNEAADLRNLCRMMIVLRVISAGVVLSVIGFLAAIGWDPQGVLPIVGLMLVVFSISAIWWLVYKSGRGLRQLICLQVGADLLIESGVVYFTGGVHSHFTIMFLVTILLAGIILSLRGALLAATLSTGLFLMASMLEEVHFGRAIGMDPNGKAMTYLFLNVALQGAFFYLIAGLSGHVSHRIRIFGTRLKSTASQLERVKMDTNLIIESMNSGLITVDCDGLIIEFNRSASRILGIAAEQAKGEKITQVLGGVAPDVCRKVAAALSNRQAEERAEVYASCHGTGVPLGISISLMSDPAGQPTGVVLVFQDLTEVKSLAERIRSADRLAALGEMSAAIAHEIRTPLASICGSVEMLREALCSGSEDRKLVDLVVRESDRLRRIIDHFLEFASARPSHFTEVELKSVLTEVLCMIRNRPGFGAEVAMELEADQAVVAVVDEETMKQVFYNLATNAIEALDGSGTLCIKLEAFTDEAGGDMAKISFADNGSGIDQDDLQHIFEPFFTRKPAGTGLGLAIVSKIVEEHGGKVDIRSTKGEGTLAAVYLPIHGFQTGDAYCGVESQQVMAATSHGKPE